MNIGFYIGGVIIFIVCVAFFRQYKQSQTAQTLLDSDHLIELTEQLVNIRLKEYDPTSPPVFITSKGLIVTYMFSRAEDIDLYLHHFSLASTNIKWNKAVQKLLISFMCNLLDENPPEKAQLSNKDVLHFTLVFKDEQQDAEYRNRVVEIPTVPKGFIDKRATITIEDKVLDAAPEVASTPQEA